MDVTFPGETCEQRRLEALQSYDVLDTPTEEGFDRITRLVTRLLDVPMATISLIDAHRQWIKSRNGLQVEEVSRDTTICQHALALAQPLIIPDTLADDRFRNNIYVSGTPFVRFYAGVPLRTPDGQALGTLCAMDTKPRQLSPEHLELLTDLAAVVMTELELRRLAAVDMLTGVASRRAFKEQAGRAVALAVRHRHPLACIMVDLDRFKEVNDAYGHAAGDQVLVQTVRTCLHQLRSSDIFGRLGGEEFGIALPHTDRAAALGVAEKLRGAIAAHPVETSAGTVAVTASFGLAMLDWSGTDLDILLERADAALYQAKAEGRDRCVLWQAPEASHPQARRRVLKAGKIAFRGGRASIDCTVRALWDKGAGLDVISTADIPETFKLRIDADDLSKLCRITEKRERHIEVAFDG